MKKGLLMGLACFLLILSLSNVSAGFWDDVVNIGNTLVDVAVEIVVDPIVEIGVEIGQGIVEIVIGIGEGLGIVPVTCSPSCVGKECGDDGCEGTCPNLCSNSHGTTSCSKGKCVSSCDSEWKDCDENNQNGCETNLNTDSKNCGACGIVCSNKYGTTSCSSGKCVSSCDSEWGDCNNFDSDGCETDLTTVSNCGACGNVCQSYSICNKGSCESELNCDYGTLDGECSDKKPYLCVSGILRETSIQCGCPEGEIPLKTGGCIEDNIREKLYLFKGKEGDYNRYDILVVSEIGNVETEKYLEAAFGTDPTFFDSLLSGSTDNSQKSLFKTKPFIGQEDKFNIYYYTIPSIDYSDNSKCKQGRRDIEKIQRFETIFNKFEWVDGKIYLTKDPLVWAHASIYDKVFFWGRPYIKISVSCGNSDPLAVGSTIVHEFGHMFGALRDEYIYTFPFAEYLPFGGKNCESVTSYRQKWKDIPGYNPADFYAGCSSYSYGRGTYNSIMRNHHVFNENTWEEGFGVINEYYLKQNLREDYSPGTCRYKAPVVCELGESIVEDCEGNLVCKILIDIGEEIKGWF